MKLYSFFNLNCEIDISYKDTMSEKRQFSLKSLIFERVFCLSELITALYSCTPVIAVFTPHHNVAIWTFRFHKKSGFVRVILKANFNSTYRPNPSLFWTGNFLLFFAEFVKSTAFYTLLLLFQRVDMFELQFDAKITIQACQLFRIAATVCKKQWI